MNLRVRFVVITVIACVCTELMLKLEELCGSAVRHLRCQLPAEDLDALVSITSDEDLANLIEEYDLAAASPPSPLKIRVFLSPPRPPNKLSATPPPSVSKSAYSSSSSSASSSSSSSSSSSYCSATGTAGSGGHGFGSGRRFKAAAPAAERCVHQMWPAAAYPVAGVGKSGGRNITVPREGNTGHVCLIHNGNYWQ